MAKKVLQLKGSDLPIGYKGLNKRWKLLLILPTFLVVFLCASNSNAKPLDISNKARKSFGSADKSNLRGANAAGEKGAYIPGEVLVFVEEDIDENEMSKSSRAIKGVDSAIRGSVRKRIRLKRLSVFISIKLAQLLCVDMIWCRDAGRHRYDDYVGSEGGGSWCTGYGDVGSARV